MATACARAALEHIGIFYNQWAPCPTPVVANLSDFLFELLPRQETLKVHAADARSHVYTQAQLEASATHDDLWNAAQREMVVRGKMHGFMRMYWCKKILEWTPSPEQALRTALYLNDRYFLDGRFVPWGT